MAVKKRSGRTKPAKKVVKKAKAALARKAKPAKQAAPVKKKPASPVRAFQVDLSEFPPESIATTQRWLCVACVWQAFTRHLELAPQKARLEIQRYTPTLEELTAPDAVRPFFTARDKQPCPYCGSAGKWHANLETHRIESGKATDALRRNLVKSLPKSGEQFVVLEQKATQQHAFFEWLEKVTTHLNLDDPDWLREISLHYLSRKEPKVDWPAQFAQTHSIRRSRRLESGWEVDNGRLFLAPMLFDELLAVQYLVSRSQLAGGLTLEGRYTLPELWARLRNSGYLRSADVHAGNPSDALEQLLAHLGGGESPVRFYYVVDRRDLLRVAKAL